MHATHHCKARQSQRGIPQHMLDYVLANGCPSRDKVVLGRREIDQRLTELEEEKRLLLKMRDKGGVTAVVGESDAVITTYNTSKRRN
ncbi:DUF4258 domain-containing protein [Pseudomonas asiatica]|uniref:DUF4258 domain-containing protein n=1 Tax=Pseudomonas asiatica TaxID=2219225 RepID=UPI0018AB1EF0|nr:DUF4258 domain-containing protein [Pseudomonas asiatica]MBF8805590.1 DUF4258 domain-containing protein [Pseudomonas asiatica]